MSRTWRGGLVTLVAAGALSLAGCAPAPVVPVAPGSAGPSESLPTPSVVVSLGPNLTKSQFAELITSGKVGDRSLKLEKFDTSQEGDPDNEASENKEQNQAASCVKMNRLADSKLIAQAADAAGTAIVQLYDVAETPAELFVLNKQCAAEQAKLDAGSAVTPIDGGLQGAARWWVIKDPGGVYQTTVAYGNVIVYVVLDGPEKPSSLITAVQEQIDQLAKR